VRDEVEEHACERRGIDYPPPMIIDHERPEHLVRELLGTASSELLGVIDTWCADNPGCVSPLGSREIDPLDEQEREAAGREGRPAFMFLDEEPLPPPHADVWVYGDPVEVRANGRAIPRLKVLTNAPTPPSTFADGSHAQLGRSDQLRAATWLVRALRDRARIYETLVRGIVALRPAIAVVREPKGVAPLQVAELVARTKLDSEVVRRSASVLRFQTPNVIVVGVVQGDELSFRRA
jgi:hypothetical protein